MHNIKDLLKVYKYYENNLIIIIINICLNYSNGCDFPITDPLNYPNTDSKGFILSNQNRSVFYFTVY